MRGQKCQLFIAATLGMVCGPALAQQAGEGTNLAPPPSVNGNPPDFSGSWLVSGGIPIKPADGQPIPFQPWAKTVYDQTNLVQASGTPWMDPRTVCLPDGATDIMIIPFDLQWVQTPKEVILLLEYNNQVRRVYVNEPHPKNLEPTWNGQSVGRWDGGTFVVDTIGFNEKAPVTTFALGDGRRSNVRHTKALHVVERFHLINGGRQMVGEMTIEDPNAFTRPWTYMLTYTWRPDLRPQEFVCADSPLDLNG